MSNLMKLIEAAKQGNLEEARSILDSNGMLVNERDASGAAALHYAAFNGHREMVRLLVDRGAAINIKDSQYGATPAGWAIEYLREMGGYLGIELDDLAYAIDSGDTRWVVRFLRRFPALREASDTKGRSFRQLAAETDNQEIRALFAV
jgi:ankyrin repeat protein